MRRIESRLPRGTNPATAAMVGMEVKWIDDARGMDLAQFEALCSEHECADAVSCL